MYEEGKLMSEKDSFVEFFNQFSQAMKEAKEKYTFENEFTFPMEIKGIKKSRQFIKTSWSCPAGSLVKVRPCGEEYEGKTYVGIFLGELAIDNTCRLNKETQELEIIPHTNPAIYVPDLQKIVFGCESWWGKVDSLEEVKEITNEDIENVWYVQLLKGMSSKEKECDEKDEN